MVDQVKTRMTAAEFLEQPETLQQTELINGEVIVSPAPELQHQECVLQTALVLRKLVDDGKVYIAPVDVYLSDSHVVQPDVLWAATEGQCISVGGKYLRGAPDLIVEVFSPGSIRHDKKTKFALYEDHGVREYWMIDPHEQYIEVYRLADSRFVQQGIFEPGETFISAVLGDKTVDVSAIFENAN
jgi:Uma2 family endonuclease